jgi:hypothetical protein
LDVTGIFLVCRLLVLWIALLNGAPH